MLVRARAIRRSLFIRDPAYLDRYYVSLLTRALKRVRRGRVLHDSRE